MKTFCYSNIKLKYRVSGKGNPVFFLHGFLESHSIWDHLFPAIETLGFTCYRFDLPGHGETNLVGENCSMHFMAELIVQFCFEQKIKNPVIFGHSMGGYVGLEIAKLMPIKLTLVHSNFWEDSPAKKENRNRAIRVIKANKNLFINEVIPNLFQAHNRSNYAVEIGELKRVAKKMSARAICACTEGMRDRIDNATVLSTQTVHLIHGENDLTVPSEKLHEELAKLSCKPKLYVVKNCGHMGMWESPKALINYMKMIVFT